MTKTLYARKALALLLSITLLLSCTVWSGVTAATVESLGGRQLAMLDFTANPTESGGAAAYSTTGNNNNSYSNGIATTVPTINAGGGYMTLKYHTNMTYNSGDKYAAFRYFPTKRISDTSNFTSRGNDDFRTKTGVAYEMTFKYKVVSAPTNAELRLHVAGIAWSNNGSTAVSSAIKDKMSIAAGTVHTTWQTATLSFVGANDNDGVHLSLVPGSVSSCSGLEVQVTDIVIATAANRPTGTTYTTDFTDYGVTAVTDTANTAATKAEVVNSGDSHGSAMKLSYLGADGLKQAGFRFFANKGTNAADKVAVSQGTPVLITLDYKALTVADSDLQLRVISGSWAWNGGVNENTGTFNTPSDHCKVVESFAVSSTAGQWKTASFLLYAPCVNAGVHVYLHSDSPSAGDAVLVDNVKVVINFAPVNVTLDLGYDSKTQTLSGVDGDVVTLPVLTRPAYVFKGWYTNASFSGSAVTTLTYSDATHGTTLYAKWEEDTSATRIVFNTNGGSALADLAGNKGTAAGELPTPTKGRYTFDGWYTDAALTTKATNVTFPQSGSITLYAKWLDPAPQAAVPAPGGKLLLSQTFEGAQLSDFVTNTNTLGKLDGVSTDVAYSGTNSLKATIKDGWNSQRGRPRIVLQDDNGQKLKVEAGKTYIVSFWVRTTIDDPMFAFYVSTMGASDMDSMISAQSGACHKLQTSTAVIGDRAPITFATNEVNTSQLYANQWTQVSITIPAAALDAAGEDNYFALGFTSNGSQASNVANWNDTPFYIDDIKVYTPVQTSTVSFDTNGGDPIDPLDTDATGTVTLPVPYKFGYTYTGWYTDPACTPASKVESPYMPESAAVTLYTKWEKALPTSSTLVQDFEGVGDVNELTTNKVKPFVIGTDGTNKVLKSTIKQGYGGNFARPIWALQMNGESAPLQLIPGTAATVTFKLKATAATSTVGFMLDTMNNLQQITTNPGTSALANAYRTMQVLGSTSHGTLNSAKNEVNNVSLQAGVWTEITVTIPSVTAHGSGAQYLVLVIGDPKSGIMNQPWTEYDLMIDDVSITTLVGGHSTNVSYDTLGGDIMLPGTGIVWTPITEEATRDGYAFDGWYLDADCSEPITEYPCQKSVTLYAGWRAAGADVMTFDVQDNFVPTVYCTTDFSKQAVRDYYTVANNASAGHAIHNNGQQMVMQNVMADGVGRRGFRLCNADGSAFVTTQGQTYQVTIPYRVTAFNEECKTGVFKVLEGSIPWTTGANGEVFEFTGGAVTAADEGVWKTATVVLEAKGANTTFSNLGLHVMYQPTDTNNGVGTLIEYGTITVQSYQLTTFDFVDGAALDKTYNRTPDGDTAAKVDTSTNGAAIYASGLGNRSFAAGNAASLVGWVYAEQDTSATINVYSVPDPSDAANASITGSKEVSLKGGKWNRVAFSFAIQGSGYTYLAVGAKTTTGANLWLDDLALGLYENDDTRVQTYEDMTVGPHANSAVVDTTLHGYYGNTVVSGKGYGSDKSLQIMMQSDEELDYSRAVLMPDKLDLRGDVGNGYIVTFMAMVEEDLDVNFGVGSSNTVNIVDRDQGALSVETGANLAVALKAGKWQTVSVVVNNLQGKTPDSEARPFMTLAAWFDGAAQDNTKNVYIDNLQVRSYAQPSASRDDTLCFEDTDAFGPGMNLNLSTAGSMTVSLEQNHSLAGYYSLRVDVKNNVGGARPQFNLFNAHGDAVKVEKDGSYRVTFWVYVGSDQPDSQIRWWLSVADDDVAYTTTDEKNAEVVVEDMTSLNANGWKQITANIASAPRDGYLRLGIARVTDGSDGKTQTYFVDDIRVQPFKEFVHTGNETVENFETYAVGDKSMVNHATASVSDDISHTEFGVNALKLTGLSHAGAARNQIIITNPATKKPYEFVKGDSYTLRMWVYYSSSSVDTFELNAWLLGVDDPKEVIDSTEKSAMNGKFEWDGSVAPITNENQMLPDVWNCYEITFTATNGKHMLLGCTNGSVQTGGYTYYIDDIEVTKPIPAYVTFDANGGAFEAPDAAGLNDKGQFVEKTAVGLFATGPSVDPYYEGYRFYGWSTDVEGQELFDLKTMPIPGPELTLYAIWAEWEGPEEGPSQIDKGDKEDKQEYITEIRPEKVWTGNAKLPELDFDDNFALEDADPVTYVPNKNVDNDVAADGLPVWLIIVIIVAGVVVVGGGAVLALLLLKNKKPNGKEVA